jgi:NAD(P)-dependent dehydrogenase (short-subunit alcohol dehydrogenase family)
MTDLTGRTVVVTGSNTGIGRATAELLAAQGASVVLACRSEAKSQPAVAEIIAATGNDQVRFHELDLADLAAVRRSAQALREVGDPIAVLVNNAGVAGQRGLTADGFELAFAINHLGHFLFTTELLPLLTAAPGSRVVNVSSGNHYRAKRLDLDTVRQPTDTFVGLRAYDRSKLCNVLFTLELARRYDPNQLKALACDPGRVASDIWQRRIPVPIANVMKVATFMKSTTDGAASSVLCATGDVATGTYYDGSCRRRAVNPVATEELAAELWARSEAWVAP